MHTPPLKSVQQRRRETGWVSAHGQSGLQLRLTRLHHAGEIFLQARLIPSVQDCRLAAIKNDMSRPQLEHGRRFRFEKRRDYMDVGVSSPHVAVVLRTRRTDLAFHWPCFRLPE